MPATIDFIVNPISGGKGKQRMLSAIERYLDPSLYVPSVLWTEGPGHAVRLARESQASVVVAVGGDGTVNEVATGLQGTGKTLGILPCGSGDGLALHLGISRDPRRAVEVLNACRRVPADAAIMNGQLFLCTAGMGLDAAVSLDFARSTRRGLGRYIALAWEDWHRQPADRFDVVVDGQPVWSGEAVFVTVANANQWGNQARIAPMASLQDGLLDLVVVTPFSTVEIPGLAGRLMTGKASSSRRFQHWQGRSIRIHRDRAGAVHYDGTPFAGGTDFDVSVLPGAQPVLIPPEKRMNP